MINFIHLTINIFVYSLSFISGITYRGFDSFIKLSNVSTNDISYIKILVSLLIFIISSFLLLIIHQHQLQQEKKYLFNFEKKYQKLNRFFALAIISVIPIVFIYSFGIKFFTNNDYLMFLLSLFVSLIMYSVLTIKRKFLVSNFSIFDSIIVIALIYMFSFIGTWNFIAIIITYMYFLGYRLNKISLFVLLLNTLISFIYLIVNYTDFQYISLQTTIISIIVVPLSIYIQYVLVFTINRETKKWISSILFILITTLYMIYI